MKNTPTTIEILMVATIIFIIASIGFNATLPYWTSEQIQITVTDKDRITTGSGDSISSKYLVFTESETFENSDCFVKFKFDSSDLQGKIEEGETYSATVYGFRVPFLSWYRNILEIN